MNESGVLRPTRSKTNDDSLRERLAELEGVAGELDAVRRKLRQREAELEALRNSGTSERDGRRAENKLEQTKAMLEAQLETSPSGVLVVDRSGRIVAYNSRFLELWRIPRPIALRNAEESLLNHVRSQLVDWDGFIQRVRDIYADPSLECQGDLIELVAGRTLSRNTHPVRLANGRVIGRVWDFVDLTDLRESEALLRQVVDLVPHFIFAKDPNGRFLLANQAVAEAYGTTVEEILGKTDADFAESEQEVERFRSDDLEVMESGQAKVIGEEQLTDAAGNVRFLQTSKIPFTFPDSDRPSVLGVAIDVTERKRAEEERQSLQAQVQHAQKLESLGILAGGIAHDFNNLLVGILGNIGLALAGMPEHARDRPHLEEAEKAAQRAADLVNQMLAYSGKGNFVVEVIDLNRLVDDLLHLLESSMTKKARLELRLAPEAPKIEGDPTQIRQVLMNLVTNASDALGEAGGAIVATTGIMDADRGYLRGTYLDEQLPAGRYAVLEISDSGCGMSPDTRARIFDPFFTTKDTGRGLGMAAVLGIVRSHRGAIRVDSQAGAGSTFRVLLPSSAHEEDTAAPEEALPESSWQGQGMILVVDDEEIIRFVARESLRAAGYGVLTAVDGHQALDVFRQHADEIAAVLLDMSMPRLDGLETFEQLRAQRPDLKIVFSSGYNEQEAIHHLGRTQGVSFIKKPYLPQTLVAKVREAVEAR